MEKEILEIVNQVKPDWSKDLIIRFLYIKLAPCFRRDLQYFLATEEEKYNQFSQGFINRFPNITCSTLADFYVDLFKDFGIYAKKIIANSAKIPLFALIVEGDYGFYFLDPINDLFSNQYGLKPYFFGIIPRYNTVKSNYPNLAHLSSEYICELDQELDIPEFLNQKFILLHENLAHRHKACQYFNLPISNKTDLRERKIELYNDEFINLGNVNGTYERTQLYQYLNDRIFNHGERHYTLIEIRGGFENPYVHFELKRRNADSIIYKEEQKDGKYILTKTL